MKKKRKIDLIKFIKTWTIIIVVIIIVILLGSKIESKKEDFPIVESQETSTTVVSNILTVALEGPEIDSKTTDWNLILVNKENKIPEDYKFELQTIENDHKVDVRIVEPLKQMLADARKQGLRPFMCSSYRSNSTQITLFNQKTSQYKALGYGQQDAEEKASYWVTLPQTSEHEIGLAVDIVSANYQALNERQESTAVQKWLIEHCTDYGFILRYPTHKKEITKINYEPWHYRYVGIENAKFMKEKGFCLEEYIAYVN